MQNRKSFLKTAVVGVVGAIGLSLVPSKVLSETPPHNSVTPIRYLLLIDEIIQLSKMPHVNKIELYAELHDSVTKKLSVYIGNNKGTAHAFPTIDLYLNKPVYMFELEHTGRYDRDTVWGLDWTDIDRTLRNIIEHKPDPFMEYPYAN